ncbi:MAG: flippase-like domain-containing protein [Herpetosiphonaceae bacterium]|nr:flippase-like domain-containing protein [Herpetosiphonaceae bacterium]
MTPVSKTRRSPRIGLWQIIKFGVALLLVGFVLSRTSWSEQVAVWQHISLPWLLLSMVAYYGSLVVMARRSWALLDQAVPFGELLEVTIIKTVVTNTIADSAGLVSYLAVLRRQHRVAISSGIASIIMARLADIVILGSVIVAAGALDWHQMGILHGVTLLLGSGALFLGLLLLATVLFRRWVVINLHRLSCYTHLDRFALTQRMVVTLTTLSDIDTTSLRRKIIQVLGYAVLTQGLTFAFAYCNMQLFHVAIEPVSLVLVVALSQLLSLIPIQVLGGLGVYDFTMLYLFGLFGLTQATMIPVLIGLRIIFYVYILILLLYHPWHRHRQRLAQRPFSGDKLAQESL